MGIQHDPDGICVVVQILQGQMRVVGQDRTNSDQDGIVLPPEPFGARLVLVRRYGHLRPVGSGDLAVR